MFLLLLVLVQVLELGLLLLLTLVLMVDQMQWKTRVWKAEVIHLKAVPADEKTVYFH